MNKNGLHTTTADEQYDKGLAAGRKVLTEGLDSDAIARRLKFDRQMVETSSPVSARFHQGRIDGIEGK